ncbi:MAG: trehalose-phosphatase [Corynebacterium sp.]|uniref:trehalose-phosphatase n=1 Tax=Corynebacterium sp. TaxID=1720 RepID=UPI0026DB6C61|nr:trehalose-phosphatase [Corynebacterium sp.]MDO4761024.1 trehalose-phosphatase [Corynebacterium sp.]
MIARVPSLLVVSDFDGTLAEFSTDAMNVPINHEAVAALKCLATLPDTRVAVLSGRDLAGLRRVSGLGDPLILAGSHGAESTLEVAANGTLSDAQRAALNAATKAFEQLIVDLPGAFVEHKPFNRVLHVIACADRARADEVYARASALDIAGVSMKPGKFIVEASVVSMNKGLWISQAKALLRPDAVVFIGDDTTDEDGFAVLDDADLGIKVGSGPTLATRRLENVPAVGEFLSQLVCERVKFLEARG